MVALMPAWNRTMLPLGLLFPYPRHTATNMRGRATNAANGTY